MADSVLASWNEGQAREAILDFVGRATTDGPDFVPQADRIATFDNDGTLWVEQPLHRLRVGGRPLRPHTCASGG